MVSTSALSSDVVQSSVIPVSSGFMATKLVSSAAGRLAKLGMGKGIGCEGVLNIISGCDWKGVRGACGEGSSASKSSRARPKGREGGARRLRLGVEGLESARFSWSHEGSFVSLLHLRRLRDAGGGVCGCFVIFALLVLDGARDDCVSAIGLASLRAGRELAVYVGRLVVRSDCNARHVL